MRVWLLGIKIRPVPTRGVCVRVVGWGWIGEWVESWLGRVCKIILQMHTSCIPLKNWHVPKDQFDQSHLLLDHVTLKKVGSH